MDREVIEQKLESLRRCLQRIEKKRPDNLEMLMQDPDLQDIITLNLTRAVQLCVDISSHVISDLETPPPDTMGQAFDTLDHANLIDKHLAIRLKKAVGFRNIAVHNYQEINWEIVHIIAQRHLVDFADFAKAIVKHLQNNTRYD